ncbi:MAG TPA: ankyrin repeat domain-containing protein [Thermoanaerobaculia bacterium]|nr:ankyrin repeat domain-containing protein [Thermoanaerobaculia bacterium]
MLPPPFIAVGNHDVAAVRRLLDDGADPNAWSPLHGQSLLFTASEVQDLTLVRLLLERGANPNQRLTIRSGIRFGQDVTVLMYAPTAAIAAALIESGADVNARDKFGTTALMNAAYHGTIDVLQVLLDCGADVTTRQSGMLKATALELAELAANLLRSWSARSHVKGLSCYQEIISLLRTAPYATQ